MMLNVGLTFFSIVVILLLIPVLIVMTLFCALFRNTLDQEQKSTLKSAWKDWLFFAHKSQSDLERLSRIGSFFLHRRNHESGAF